MLKKKKISRKELLSKPDEYISLSVKILDFISYHKKTFIISGIIFVFILSLISGFAFYGKHLEARAQRLLYQADQYIYHEKNEEILKNYLININRIIDEYSNTYAANYALLFLGNHFYRLKDYDKSIDCYNKFLNGKVKVKYLRAMVYNSIGYCYQEQGNYEKAIDNFYEIIKIKRNIFNETTYLHLGECYEKLNNKDKAIDSYQKLINQYPHTYYINIVEGKISKLK